ncbi:MAG: YgjV family protein [bacterium]|nr:YgjV family protein [bacterium]
MALFFGIVGLLIGSSALWLRNERKQDIWFVIGGICLLIYSISIGSVIFIILQLVFIISASVEILKLKKKNGSQK